MAIGNVSIVGTPRSGSSFLASKLVKMGYRVPSIGSTVQMSASEFNPDGYFENTYLNLLNDQIIRSSYGKEFSFLYPPRFLNQLIVDESFLYDLDENTVDVPMDYLTNLTGYSGHDWDVWGITRMLPGQKWYRAYSQNLIRDGLRIKGAIETVNAYAANETGLVWKDSRLTFTLPFFKNSFTKCIFLTRDTDTLINSIKNHYGNRIFSHNVISNKNWVSNHFNYKVRPQEVTEFIERYQSALDALSQSMSVLKLSLKQLNTDNIDLVLRNYLAE